MLTGRRFRLQGFISSLSVLMLGTGLLIGANVVAADSVQVQSYQRDSETAECPNQPWETPWQADWGPNSSWTPSWEQWANNSTGGWTCTRTIVWAKSSPSGSSSTTYNVGDIGPGGGLVFLKSGGRTYEMAPKTWGGGATDPTGAWCNVDTDIPSAEETAVGTGAANTAAMLSVCASGAGNLSVAYQGGGFTDWHLPSQAELNAMCNYSRDPSNPAAADVSCRGAGGSSQDAAFAIGSYGFAANDYRTSTQYSVRKDFAWVQFFADGSGDQTNGFKSNLAAVRPIRAF